MFRLLSDVPRILLEHGADVNARDSLRGLTPLGWAEAKCDKLSTRRHQ